MNTSVFHKLSLVLLAAFLVLPAAFAPQALAQETKGQFTIYGFTMLDMGYDFKQNNPQWFDVVRPSRLPSYKNEFGKDGQWYAGVRQTRFGVKTSFPTDLGEFKTWFEFDLFGVGVDAGQTTIRPRHFYGELGHFGAGQTNSPFMDIDIFPNSLEYWGPNGMLFLRNVQVRWTPMQGERELMFALEKPGASADGGDYAERIQIRNIRPRYPLPDFSAACKFKQPWGYFRFSGMLRDMAWDDMSASDTLDYSGHAVGWGLSASSNVYISKDVLRLLVTYGAGVENYYNDAPFDVGLASNSGDPKKPATGKALPDLGIAAFLDHVWNEQWASTIGVSYVKITNSDMQSASAYKMGAYALANILYMPVPNFMTGFEFQWGHRENNSDGWKVDDYRIQFGAKFSFSATIGG